MVFQKFGLQLVPVVHLIIALKCSKLETVLRGTQTIDTTTLQTTTVCLYYAMTKIACLLSLKTFIFHENHVDKVEKKRDLFDDEKIINIEKSAQLYNVVDLM